MEEDENGIKKSQEEKKNSKEKEENIWRRSGEDGKGHSGRKKN